MNDPVQAWIVAAIVAAGGLLMLGLAKRWTGASLREILFSWDPRQPSAVQQTRVSTQRPRYNNSDSKPSKLDPNEPAFWPVQEAEALVEAAQHNQALKGGFAIYHAIIHRGSPPTFRVKHTVPIRPVSDLLEEMKQLSFGGRISKPHDKGMSQAFHRSVSAQRRTLH